ncbi:MAG: delta-aminolevulinic acid dehydratase [Verrucomicrobia bacterium GWC2_42_7]|nr:MAG: delta-aminolevulinic acid dehydratase [Verrucomicrobia bacterium GWC2_42_7]
MKIDLQRRPRRLRQSPGVRDLVQETFVLKTDLIQPLFVIEGKSKRQPIESMPGIDALSIDLLVDECELLGNIGIRGVALFPRIDNRLKDERGTEALNPDSLILKAIRAIKKRVPSLILIADIALDPYTTHGHDGIFNKRQTDVDNDATVKILAQMATLHAKGGVDWVAPSDMMDGRVRAIRHSLDKEGHVDTCILAYSAKFASAYYSPFREAIGSNFHKKNSPLCKRTYQLNPGNRREALQEAVLDELEGADMLMVKPAGLYLDILREIRNNTHLPVAAYQVSGEYSQIYAASQNGWLDLTRCRDESLLAIKRAGADIILSYFAKQVALSLS